MAAFSLIAGAAFNPMLVGLALGDYLPIGSIRISILIFVLPSFCPLGRLPSRAQRPLWWTALSQFEQTTRAGSFARDRLPGIHPCEQEVDTALMEMWRPSRGNFHLRCFNCNRSTGAGKTESSPARGICPLGRTRRRSKWTILQRRRFVREKA